MTPEERDALRAPFPANAIGQLPKPTKRDAPKGSCNVCGGYHGLPAVHLDYVGHAAATDRLLQVDPDWTWEPFALTADGLPALDREGNLWIRLTVAGVTRPGVGDGSSLKEKIGDAIRNAGMRFGVALDLWAKEDLHTATNDADTPTAPRKRAPKAAPERPANVSADGEIASPTSTPAPVGKDDRRRKRMFALYGELGIKGRDQMLATASAVVAREITTSNDLTAQEIEAVITFLEGEPKP